MPFPLDHYIEASHVDYKERLEEKKPRSWLKSVSAFANTEGGRLIFGVKNEPREVVGLENPQAVVSRLTELIKVRIDPTPRYRVREVEIEGKSCVDLEVQDGPAYPYYYAFDGSHTAYVRHGDQSEEATSRELNELILQGMNQTFDALPSSYRVGDVSFTLLAATFKNLKKEDFDLEKDLPSAGLVTDDGQITNGGLLLCDQGILKQSRIFCTRWKGNYKGSIEEDALDDKEFQGASLITLLQNAEDFVRNNSKNPWSIRGMTREERSDYPYKAVREVLVNALIHRNYQILGSEIHVEVFDDRREITSPGGMMNGRRVQDMDIRHIPSMRRNQVISDVFSRLGFMERRGSGIDRILNSYVEVAQKPTFYSDSDFFIVTLPNRSVATPAQVSMESVASGEESALKVCDTYERGFVLFTVLLNSIVTLVLPVGLLLMQGNSGNLALAAVWLFFIVMGPGVMSPVYKLMFLGGGTREIDEGVKRIDRIFDENPIPEPVVAKNPVSYDIEFDHVGFSYENREQATRTEALRDVSFVARQGEITALVGPSGSGKSTVASLIPRFWDVAEGNIRIGGVDVRDIANERLMNLVSFVFQDTFLFYDTLYENIAVGCPGATRQQVEDAARAAQCHDFIMNLPNGYETRIGDKGVYLSGGESQRICVARAILKNAPILVLDEATAFADPENEYKMQRALQHLIKDKTVIVIAHRLSSIISAQQIVVLKEGKVVQIGTHKELTSMSGVYRQMWDAYTDAFRWELNVGNK